MKQLSMRLGAITKTDAPLVLEEAGRIISKLKKANMRWNIDPLNIFLKKKQRELFLDL